MSTSRVEAPASASLTPNGRPTWPQPPMMATDLPWRRSLSDTKEPQLLVPLGLHKVTGDPGPATAAHGWRTLHSLRDHNGASVQGWRKKRTFIAAPPASGHNR